MGNPPELACDGLEAVRLFGGHTFDLALMDLRMPVMDGLTATARIRVVEHQQRRTKPVPLIAYTSEPIAGNQSAWSQSGITATLAKPCAAVEMGECLEHWCGIKPGYYAALSDFLAPTEVHGGVAARVRRPA